MPEENKEGQNSQGSEGNQSKEIKGQEGLKELERLRVENSDLIKEINEFKRMSKEKLDAEEQAKVKALEEQGKWKEAAELRAKQLEELNNTIKKNSIKNALKDLAYKEKIKNFKILETVDYNGLDYDSETGTVKGAEQAIAKLKEEMPFAFGENGVGGNANNANTRNFGKIDLGSLQNLSSREEIENTLLDLKIKDPDGYRNLIKEAGGGLDNKSIFTKIGEKKALLANQK